MTRKIALLRGVNVGGNNKLPMTELAGLMENAGCANVRTYIQSGNVVFDGELNGADIAAAINSKFGFSPLTFVLTAQALKKAAADCPYRTQAQAAPKSVHLFFFDGAADKTAALALDAVKFTTEEFVISKSVMYLHTPDGLATSKIAVKADRLLKTKTTARNWNTVCALMELAGTLK